MTQDGLYKDKTAGPNDISDSGDTSRFCRLDLYGVLPLNDIKTHTSPES